jgi:MFS superfamily sulfate permease-like transporter
MTLEQLKEQLESLSDKELFRFLKKSICRSLAEVDDVNSDAAETLDIVYSECQRRGKERLYDKTYETVSKNPDTCQAIG